jgi:CHAT domain-containing protein/tetratricopeptide (TPR) repeat protein
MNRARKSVLQILVCCFGLFWVMPHAISDEEPITALVEQFFDTYTKEDLDGFMGLWSGKPEALKSRREIMQQIFASTENIEVKSYKVVELEISDDEAKVRLAMEMAGVAADTGEPSPFFGQMNRTLKLVKVGNVWKISAYFPTEQELVDALKALDTKAKRMELLGEKQALLTSQLVRTLYQGGDAQAESRAFDEAFRLNDIAFEVAEKLDDTLELAWCYVYRGFILEAQFQFVDAAENYKSAFDLSVKVDDKLLQANTQNLVGNAYNQAGESSEALAAYETALKIWQELRDKRGEASAQFGMAYAYRSLGKTALALEALQATVLIRQEIGDRAGLARVLGEMGRVYRSMGQFQEAVQAYKEGLQIARESRNRALEAMTLNHMGIVYELTGAYEKALDAYENRLKLADEIGDRGGKAATLNNVGIIHQLRGDYKLAHETLDESLNIAREIGDKVAEASALFSIGNVYQAQGAYNEALEKYKESQQIKRRIFDPVGVATVSMNIGMVHKSTGDYPTALKKMEEALTLIQAVGDKEVEAKIWGNIGAVYVAQRKYADAFVQYQKALKLAQETGMKLGEATALMNLGALYQSTGQLIEAIGVLTDALKLFEEMEDKKGAVGVLNNIGNVYQSAESYSEARTFYDSALEIAGEIGDQQTEAMILNNIGMVEDTLGKQTEAVGFYNDALTIMQEIGDRAGESATLNNIGVSYRLMERYNDALETLNAALKISESIGDLESAANAYTNIGYTHLAQKEWSQGRDAFQKSIDYIKQIRDPIKAPSMQIGFFKQFTLPYYGLATCQLELGNDEAAFQTAESAKAQTLIQLLEGGGVTLVGEMTAEETEKERTLNARIVRANLDLRRLHRNTDQLQTLLFQVESGFKIEGENGRTSTELQNRFINEGIELSEKLTIQKKEDGWRITDEEKKRRYSVRSDNSQLSIYAHLREDLAAARRAYDEFRSHLYITHPKLKENRGESEPLTVPQATEWLNAQDAEDVLILEYLVGHENTWLFALTGTGALEVHSIPMTRAELTKHITALRRGIEAKEKLGVALKALNPLIEPIQPILQKNDKGLVCIIPDDLLWNVPFAALQANDGKYLIETHAVFYAPSLTALKAQVESTQGSPRPTPNPLLAMAPFATSVGGVQNQSLMSGLWDGLKPLPSSKDEVTAIAGLFQTTPYLQADATETLAKAEAGRVRFLHFATHGKFNPMQGMYSGLAMADAPGEDGYLEAREIVDLTLNADLAVLSACETARGHTQGEGLVGLSWAFFVAGCPSTVVSQWKVADPSTAAFMKRFYGYLKQGQTKVDALTEAMRWMIKHSYHKDGNDTIKHDHPYYWAPFILMGAYH